MAARPVTAISIHALREEGDHPLLVAAQHDGVISIHALREEGDSAAASRCIGTRNFYPRPPRGGRPDGGIHRGRRHDISIHALREEGDPSLYFLV